MNSNTPDNQSEKINSIPTILILINNALIASTLTSAAYLIGITFHQSYLTALKIPYTLHTKNSSDYFLYAFQALLELFPLWLTESTKVSGAILIFLISISWFLANLVVEWVNNSQLSRRGKSRNISPKWKIVGKAALYPTTMIFLAVYIPLLLSIIMLFPVLIGEKMANKVAARDIAAMSAPCGSNHKKYIYCSDVMDGEKSVATGYIIDTSEKYVTIFENGKSRTIPIEGKEIRAFTEK